MLGRSTLLKFSSGDANDFYFKKEGAYQESAITAATHTRDFYFILFFMWFAKSRTIKELF